MSFTRTIVILIGLFFLICTASADHSTLRNDEFGTNPINSSGQPSGSFNIQLRELLEHEIPQRLGRSESPWVYSGGIHGTTAGFTPAAFATEAFLPERVNQVATAITYVAAAADTCWTIISSDNNGITNWNRTGTSAYYHRCGAASQPALPANSAWLMQVSISGSAITSVVDLRQFPEPALLGWVNVRDPRYGAVGDGTMSTAIGTDDTAAFTAATAATRVGGTLYIPAAQPGKCYRLIADWVVAKAINIVGTGYRYTTSG